MKNLQIIRSYIRGLAAGVGVLAFIPLAHAAPYASAIQVTGTNVQFIMNESGANVTVTYGDGTTNASFNGVTTGTNLAAGPYTFGVPGTNTTYQISCFKEGTGVPFQYSVNTGTWVGGWPATLRAVAVNPCPVNGPSFGRVYVATTGSATNRQYGVYGITPDLQSNSFYGGNSINAAITSIITNTVTFTSAPGNGATFTVFGHVTTWTTNTVTNTATQVAVTNSAAAAATNMANSLNLNIGLYPGLTVSVASNVVTLAQPNLLVALSTGGTIAVTGASGPFGPAIASGNGGFGSGPYRMYCAPNGDLYVTDAEDAGANCYYFSNNCQVTNAVFSVIGRIAGQNANQHGNINDIAIQGSWAAGNLQIWTADNSMPVPSYFANSNSFPGPISPGGPYGLGLGGIGTQNFGAQETEVGDACELFRYDIGNAAYPVTNTPNFAATTMLNGGFADSQVMAVALDPTSTNFVYAMARRDNGSDGSIQVFSQSTGARVYSSLHGNPNATFNTASFYDLFVSEGVIGGTANGPYGGVRISPDGHYLCAYHDNQLFLVCNLTNGIPDESSMQILTITGSSTTGRHFGWDAADNLYSADSDLSVIHVWDLGVTATAITGNDLTGNNGTFQLILPSSDVTVVNGGNASQNYGVPIAGNFTVSIGTANSNSVAIAFTIGGTATNGVNYVMGTSLPNGVTVTSNSATSGTITFPPGQITANIPITPTTNPAIGPTLTVTLKASPGTNYIVGSPATATVSIANTGSQYVFVSANLTATSMSRSISNDYAEFVLNRWGDTNGPSNSVGNINPTAYTVTNFSLTGTAVYGTDYVAGPQVLVPGQVPVVGSPGVTINPGVSSITCLVGDPVPHTNVLVHTLTNTTVIVSVPSPGTAQNGTTYTGSGSSATLSELDNRVGQEYVVWSDPLTNSAANTYTVTYASTNLNGGSNTLPVVLSPYLYTNGGANNGNGSLLQAPSNNFDVELGFPVTNENSFETAAGVGFFGPAYSPPYSPVMSANGWTNCLRMAVDKPSASPSICGVNFYPTTNTFTGNYALRFDMYLSVWSGALSNVAPLNFPRQFAAFGINHQGTNCNWRLSVSQQFPVAGIANPTNADGVWFAIDAGDDSLTPADYDAFASPPIPNEGTSDFVSSAGANEAGVFKKPPFAITDGDVDGAPINQWVSVSVETSVSTNVIVYVDGSPVIGTGSSSGPIGLTNYATSFPSDWSGGSNINNGSGNWTNGVPMLGYLQPYNDQSDESAFVYYSNVRIVELSPTIVGQPLSQLVLAGSNVTITATAAYATNLPNVTNAWYKGNATPATLVQTDTTNTTSFTDTLTISNISATGGTNYFSVFTDAAGSITNNFPACIEVIGGPANQTVNQGAKATFTVTASGQDAPIGYQWYTNSTALVNNTKYAGVTTASLSVSNCQAADTAVTYSCAVSNSATNLAGVYVNVYTNYITTAGASLAVTLTPTGAVVSPASQTNEWGSSATFTVTSGGTPPFTYGWKKAGTNLYGPSKYSGTNAATLTISNLTTADTAATYTAGVTNSAGSTTSSAGSLIVFIPPPSFVPIGGVLVAGGNVTMSFTSTNQYDTTNAFSLLSSTNVVGPYTNAPGSVFSGSNGTFQVVVPEGASPTMFYELQHAP